MDLQIPASNIESMHHALQYISYWVRTAILLAYNACDVMTRSSVAVSFAGLSMDAPENMVFGSREWVHRKSNFAVIPRRTVFPIAHVTQVPNSERTDW